MRKENFIYTEICNFYEFTVDLGKLSLMRRYLVGNFEFGTIQFDIFCPKFKFSCFW